MNISKRTMALLGLMVAAALVVAFVGVPYLASNAVFAVGSPIIDLENPPGSNESNIAGLQPGGSLPGGARIPSGATILSSKGQVALGGGVLYSTPGSSIGLAFPAGTYDVYATFTDASGQVWYLIFNGFLIWVQG